MVEEQGQSPRRRHEHMTVLARRRKTVPLALLVRLDPERNKVPPCRIALLARVELDRLAEPLAFLHPHREVRQPLEHRVLLLHHDLHLRCRPRKPRAVNHVSVVHT